MGYGLGPVGIELRGGEDQDHRARAHPASLEPASRTLTVEKDFEKVKI